MRIAVNAVAANQAIRTGVGTYAFSLLQALMKITPSDVRGILYTAQTLEAHWGTLPDNWVSRVVNWSYPGWEPFGLRRAIAKDAPNLYFAPSSGMMALPKRLNIRTLATVHDVGFTAYPNLYAPGDRSRQWRAHRSVAKRADHVLAVSDWTKQTFTSAFSFDPSRVSTTPLGVDHVSLQMPVSISDFQRKHQFGNHLIVCVARVDEKKNIEHVLDGFHAFKRTRGIGDPYQLVIAGPDGFGAARIHAYADRLSSKDDIFFVGAVNNEEKTALYQHATVYMNLSWYEGFGLTPVEAAVAGTPSILSDIPAHREVMGDTVQFVQPNAIEEISRALDRLVSDVSAREDLAKRAAVRAQSYMWETTAERTWEVMQQLYA